MNEVTRIHIAKTAYDIEIAAKKQLEKYIKSLENYAHDSDVVADIEIRMTELLAERGVRAGGVIAVDDVSALRQQLGEPYEFAEDEGDIAVGDTTGDSGDSDANGQTGSRKLYRSTNDAVLGGVLSGIASYLGVNPLWARLVFAVLCFASFGLALVVYLLLWASVPPARTAAEKLQLAGRPVTAQSLRQAGRQEETARPNVLAPLLQKIITVCCGIISAIIATISFGVAVWAVAVAHAGGGLINLFLGERLELNWQTGLVVWIVIGGIVLFAALMTLVAYAFFVRRLSKKVLVSCVVIIALGLGAIVTSISMVSVFMLQREAQAQRALQTTTTTLDASFAQVQTVVFDQGTTTAQIGAADRQPFFRYVVDGSAPRYELHSLPESKLAIRIDGTTAHLSLKEATANMGIPSWLSYQTVVTVYGPAPTSLETNLQSGSVTYEGPILNAQPASLAVLTNNSQAALNITGTFARLRVTGQGRVDATAASVQALEVQAGAELTVQAGTVGSLDVTQPTACPATDGEQSPASFVSVVGIAQGNMTYNGAMRSAQTYDTACGSVLVGAHSAWGSD